MILTKLFVNNVQTIDTGIRREWLNAGPDWLLLLTFQDYPEVCRVIRGIKI